MAKHKKETFAQVDAKSKANNGIQIQIHYGVKQFVKSQFKSNPPSTSPKKLDLSKDLRIRLFLSLYQEIITPFIKSELAEKQKFAFGGISLSQW